MPPTAAPLFVWRRWLPGRAWLLAVALGGNVCAAANELGRPIVRDFPPGKSNIGHLCQAVTQDGAGFIYVANQVDARVYDGETWRFIKLSAESAGIRRFAVTAGGTVYMGGAGVLGYFRGAGENAAYQSLAGALPPTELGYVDIFDVLAVGETVYFADEEKILIWRDGRFAVVPCRSPPHSRGARLHRVGETVYVTGLDRALSRLVEDRLEIVADDPVLRQNQIVLVEAGPAGALVLLTAERGFFQLADGCVAPWPTEANRWLEGRSILRALRLQDGSLAVLFTAVSGDGGMRFAADGRYLGPIDNSIGLYVKTLRDLFCDREGGLWLGSETGFFRIEWPSAVTVFDAVNGLAQGTVVDVARHNGELHAATAEGVFRLEAIDATGRGARFVRALAQPAFSLLSHPDGLLALTYTQVLVRSGAGFVAVAALPPSGGGLQRSKRDLDRVWISTTHGLQSVRHTLAGWCDEGPWPGSEEEARRMLAADGDGEPGGETAPGSRPWSHLVRTAAGAITRVREETTADGTVHWVCGANGLVRVAGDDSSPATVPYPTLLFPDQVQTGDSLPPEHAALGFRYVALRHRFAEGVSYQTRLVGHDRDWTNWSARRERTFTRLPAGDYRFEVRATDAEGRRSLPASLTFAVRAPWWLTTWAFFGYAATGAGLVAGLVRFRTRVLRHRAARLEDVVAARTGELAQKNLELIRLNRLEFDEKTAARLAEEKARLEMLRYQLNPHFLYNTLASISSSLPAGLSSARGMVERLADFCRLTLHRSGGSDWTSLGAEMRILRVYLEIEHSRWGELLDVAIDCDPACEDEPLPYFLLLPLVENALKYGRATSPDRVGLRLVARRELDGALVLEVANTGAWVQATGKDTASSLGIGLENLRERLERYYPHAHELKISAADGWVTVTLKIPGAKPAQRR